MLKLALAGALLVTLAVGGALHSHVRTAWAWIHDHVAGPTEDVDEQPAEVDPADAARERIEALGTELSGLDDRRRDFQVEAEEHSIRIERLEAEHRKIDAAIRDFVATEAVARRRGDSHFVFARIRYPVRPAPRPHAAIAVHVTGAASSDFASSDPAPEPGHRDHPFHSQLRALVGELAKLDAKLVQLRNARASYAASSERFRDHAASLEAMRGEVETKLEQLVAKVDDARVVRTLAEIESALIGNDHGDLALLLEELQHEIDEHTAVARVANDDQNAPLSARRVVERLENEHGVRSVEELMTTYLAEVAEVTEVTERN